LGLVYKELRQYSEAAIQFEKAFELDQDRAARDKELSLLFNMQGNDFYALSQYRPAIDMYTRAIERDPNNDVIQSNLAGAWENLREAGTTFEALDTAIAAYEKANSINATEKYQRA